MAKRVIKLLGEPIQNEDAKAAEAITPGHLMAQNASGDWIKHASASTKTPAIFALEREEMGADIDDAYAIGDTVKAGHFHAGTRVNALIASGQDLDVGELLDSAGNGTLKATATVANAIARSLDDTGGAVLVTTRVRAEII